MECHAQHAAVTIGFSCLHGRLKIEPDLGAGLTGSINRHNGAALFQHIPSFIVAGRLKYFGSGAQAAAGWACHRKDINRIEAAASGGSFRRNATHVIRSRIESNHDIAVVVIIATAAPAA